MGSHILGFWGEKVLHNYGYQTYKNVFTVGVTQSGPSMKKKKKKMVQFILGWPI